MDSECAITSEAEMYRVLDDLEFDREFRPLKDDSGAWRQLWWSEPVDGRLLRSAAEERRIWTVVEVDGRVLVVNGNHLVNRLHYLVTEKATSEDAEIEVADLDEP